MTPMLILLLLTACEPDTGSPFATGTPSDDDDATGADDDDDASGTIQWFQDSTFDPEKVYLASRYQVFGDEHRFVVTDPEVMDAEPRAGLPWQDELYAWVREDGRLVYQFNEDYSAKRGGPMKLFVHDDGIGYPESPAANDEDLPTPCSEGELYYWRWHPIFNQPVGTCSSGYGSVRTDAGDVLPGCPTGNSLGYYNESGSMLCFRNEEMVWLDGTVIPLDMPDLDRGNMLVARRAREGWLAVYDDPNPVADGNAEMSLYQIDEDGSGALLWTYPRLEDTTDTWLAPVTRREALAVDADGILYRWGEGTDDLLKLVIRYDEDGAQEIWNGGPSIFNNVSAGVRLVSSG